MSRTSATVKDRWNRNNYDSLLIRLPRGRKTAIEALAHEHGESINGFVNALLRAATGLTEQEWYERPEEMPE